MKFITLTLIIFLLNVSHSYASSRITLNDSFAYINNIVEIYDSINGEATSSLAPQRVYVLEENGYWLKINTWQGIRWLYKNFTPPIAEIYYFLSKERFADIAVSYENLSTNFMFSHNGDTRFFGASATKAPFALYIWNLIQNGHAYINERIAYTSADYWHGSGFIRHRNRIGDTFTRRELLFLMISPSDNIATRMLRRSHGLNGYREFMYSIGANPNFVQNLTYSHLSADEAAIIMRAIFNFINNDNQSANYFREDLIANRYPFIRSHAGYYVASKSGWAANLGGAFHDMAIIYAPSPFTLAILSSRDGTSVDRRHYDEISYFFENFNRRWFFAG